MWKRSRMRVKTTKKGSAVLMLFAVLLPFVQLIFSLDQHRSVHATDSTALVDNDKLKLSVGSELVGDDVAWTFRFDKKKSTEAKRQLKFKLMSGEASYQIDQFQSTTHQANWQNGGEDDRDWIVAKAFSFEETEDELKITLPYEISQQLSIQVQMDEETMVQDYSVSESLANTEPIEAPALIEKKLVRNILAEKDAVPHQLASFVPKRQDNTESEPQTPAEVPATDPEETEAEEDPDPEVDLTQTVEALGTTSSVGSFSTLGPRIAGRNLIIAPDAFAELSVESTIGGQQIVKKNPIATHDTNRAVTDLYGLGVNEKNMMYENFNGLGNGGGAVAIIYPAQNSDSLAAGEGTPLMGKDKDGNPVSEVIELEYSYVGYFDQGDADNPDLRKVGAQVKISNISVGPQPSWGGEDQRPYIEFSNNLFSGVLYGYIKKMDIEFTFFDAESGEKVDFSEGNEVTISFASLNAYVDVYTTDEKSVTAHEFAGLEDGGEVAEGSAGSLLAYNETGSYEYDSGSYYAEKAVEGVDFDDWLGSSTYHKAAVAFPITGTSHQFKFGSTWGRAWNTFASSSATPVAQPSPTKTVQPLKQYQAGDAWNTPSGESSGYGQRYFNDLDVLEPWELGSDYRVDGHDIDKPNELAPGVPSFEQRYVESGKDYYYFINQETINLGSTSLVAPSTYKIVDELPIGIELIGGLDQIVVYDLLGNPIQVAIKKTGTDVSSINGQTLTIVLSEAATTRINRQSGLESNHGKDFSIRLSIRVTGDRSEMINQAISIFGYGSGQATFEKTTNRVKIRLGEPAPETTDFSFTKVDEDKQILQGVKFELYATDAAGNKTGNALQLATSDNQGQVSFTDLVPGVYVISESAALNGYITYEDFTVTVNKDLTITGLPDGQQVVNQRKAFELILTKQDSQTEKALSGAEFELTKADGSDPRTLSTNSERKLTFDQLDWREVYRLTEKKAPDNYRQSDTIYQIEYDKASDTWKVSRVTSDDNSGEKLEEIATGKSSALKITAELTVKNDPVMPLPQTGGSGRTIFWIIGGILLVIASGYFIWRRQQAKGVR